MIRVHRSGRTVRNDSDTKKKKCKRCHAALEILDVSYAARSLEPAFLACTHLMLNKN